MNKLEKPNYGRESLIYSGSRVYTQSDKELEKLSNLSFTENRNCIRVISRIPEYFETNDLFTCMMLAFAYGDDRGRFCERDLIKHNEFALFYSMKTYASLHNGELPKTPKDLEQWKNEIVKELGQCEDDHQQ